MKPVSYQNRDYFFSYDLEYGIYSVQFNNSQLKDVYANCILKNGDELASNSGVISRDVKEEIINDGFGSGKLISITNKISDDVNLIQRFYLYDNQSFMLTDVQIVSDTEQFSNHMAPIVTKAPVNTNYDRYIFVPYDNDQWIRYGSYKLDELLDSYEVSAIFNNDSRNGLIIGSITHDTWKTALQIQDKIINVYGGASGTVTRDTVPHGYVHGKEVTSPKIFVGDYNDYRLGMEAYAAANAIITPPLEWDGGVLYGWNSWSAVGDKLDAGSYINASNFLHDNVQNVFNNGDGKIYVNFDSFWDNLTEQQTDEALRIVRDNNQLPGWYWTPFVYWGSDYSVVVKECPEYTYADLVLRDDIGNVLPTIAGGTALDPTHPGTIKRMDVVLTKFREKGYRYIKLDFMTHGALEGKHYLDMTGTQAYNYGMRHLQELLKYDNPEESIFIDLSISPLFPYNYAHSRRISCDVFAAIKDSEYLLNSQTYGWWHNKSLYAFNDPDHIVLYKTYSQAASSEEEARTRLNAAVICGGVMIVSDNYNFGQTNSQNTGMPQAQERAVKLLTNKNIIELSRKHKPFLAVEGNTLDRACSTFVMNDGGRDYLAVFNFSSSEKEITVSLDRAGLTKSSYIAKDLWTDEEAQVNGSLTVKLNPYQSFIYELR